jgi:hypothetical protein
MSPSARVKRNPARRFPRATRATALVIAVAAVLARPPVAVAQATTSSSGDERIKALERERDELKQRNGLLELRLKQLQTTVNRLINETLDTLPASQAAAAPPVPHPPGEPPATDRPAALPSTMYQLMQWRSVGPPYTRSAGLFSPLQQPVDVVNLAVAYQDALAELKRIRQAQTSKPQTSSADLDSAQNKVRLLRSITTTLRDELADEVDRMHKLSAVHAVPTMDVRNLDSKLKIVNLILAHDPEAGSTSNEPAAENRAKKDGLTVARLGRAAGHCFFFVFFFVRRVGSAVQGSSGQECLGYRARKSLRTRG